MAEYYLLFMALTGHVLSQYPNASLSSAEENAVRASIYSEFPLVFTHTSGPRSGQRELLVPDRIRKIHSAKPRATRALLLAITEGGRSDDAYHAACIAIALEESPIAAVMIADFRSVASIDQLQGQTNQSFRSTLVGWIRKVDASGGKK